MTKNTINEIKFEYIKLFKELPDVYMMISLEDEKLVKLMEKAVKRKKKIANEELAELYKNDEYDLILKNNFKKTLYKTNKINYN